MQSTNLHVRDEKKLTDEIRWDESNLIRSVERVYIYYCWSVAKWS